MDRPFIKLDVIPDPKTVRPKEILKKSLDQIKKKWKRRGHYDYLNDRLLSVRTDMTFQGIKGNFALKVYKTHAIIALENHDISQFKQCLIQLENLFKTTVLKSTKLKEFREDFAAFKLLFYILEEKKIEATKLIKGLNAKDKVKPNVRFALRMRVAISIGNYAKFFALYEEAKKKSGKINPYFRDLIEIYFEKNRMIALKVICKAYGESASVELITKLLYFKHRDKCKEFLLDIGCIFDKNEDLDCKNSLPKISIAKA